MIKRVKTARAVPPRRGLLPRLRNIRIRSKLGLILIIPILALVGLAMVRLAESMQTVMQAQEAMRYATVAERAAELGEQLQAERTLAAELLTASPEKRQQVEAEYRTQSKATDDAATKYTEAREQLPSADGGLATLLDNIDSELEELPELRDAIDDRNIHLSAAIFRYRIILANILAYRESLAHIADNPDSADLARGSAALGAYTEYLSQEQVVGILVLTSGELTPAEQRDFLSTLAGQEESRRAFDNAVDEEHIAELQRLTAGQGVGSDAALALEGRFAELTNAQIRAMVQDAQRYETVISRAVPGSTPRLAGGAGAEQWSDAMAVEVALTRLVEEQLDAEFQASIQAQHDALIRRVVAEFVVVLVVLVVAAMIALLIARSMARSLRRLREGALAVAYESLPQSVARLRDPETLGEMTPEQVAASVKDPVQVRGRDEIGQVAQAFNVVHREAVRIAAEQAALRANVATMFINLARRSQVLVDRLIGHLDRLERGEEDPDRLAELFKLDHLATRMRRNDENLLVLAGADSSRVQREPAPLSDVLRAAQSEVEQYTRIEFGIVDRDVEVAPHAVNDVVHLLAELFDNATSFSSPDTVVVVDARRAGDRAILQIEDRGIGISAEQLAELNERLANPPMVDVTVSRMMGLVVVGRLAARHGIRVELRAARERGTIADVILPAGVLIMPQRAGRQHTLGLPQSRSPLALEGAVEPSTPSAATPAQSGPGWQPPSGQQSWEPAQDWDRAPQMPSSGQDDGARQLPSRMDMPGAIASALSGSNGTPESQLPRRRPGERLDQGGQQETPEPHDQTPMPPSRRRTGVNELLGRRPAAEPRAAQPPSPGPEPRTPAPSRESIHSAELPMPAAPEDTRPAASAPSGQPEALQASQQTEHRPADHGMSLTSTFGVTSGGYPIVDGGGSTTVPRQVPRSEGGSAPAPRPTPQPSPEVSADGALIPPNADDTMELPIFREVESAWFRTKRPARPVQSGDQGQAGQAAAENRGDGGASSATTDSGWRTAADEGWRKASAAAQSHGTGTTKAGLPKRVPMAQLVPGGVEGSPTGTRSRSPDAVRGLLSAYHRGVQRGRQSSARTSSDEGPGKEHA